MKLTKEITVGHLLTVVAMLLSLGVFVIRTESQITNNTNTLGRVIELQEKMAQDIDSLKAYRIRLQTIEELNGGE